MKYHHKEIFEIIFHARGGQGAKTAAEIIAQAAMDEGKYVQSFPNFGPERSGAPTKTYLKISKNPIRNHEPVIDPDAILVLDETLLDGTIVTDNLDSGELLIINTKKPADEIAKKIGFRGKVYPVDANRISLETIGQLRPNTVILGKFIKVTEIVRLKSVVAEFRKIFEDKIGKENCDKNILAIEKAYDSM